MFLKFIARALERAISSISKAKYKYMPFLISCYLQVSRAGIFRRIVKIQDEIPAQFFLFLAVVWPLSVIPIFVRQSGQYHLVVLPGGSLSPTHSRWNHSRSHCKMQIVSKILLIRKQHVTYVVVLALNHGTKANLLAQTVSWLIGID